MSDRGNSTVINCIYNNLIRDEAHDHLGLHISMRFYSESQSIDPKTIEDVLRATRRYLQLREVIMVDQRERHSADRSSPPVNEDIISGSAILLFAAPLFVSYR